MTKNTPRPFFIAMSGKKQTGKDSSAQMIVQLLEAQNKKVAVTAFAEPLKEMCINILGLSREGVYGTDAQKNSPSHILWDGFTLDIRLKYSKEIDLQDGRTLPRSGAMSNREVLQVMGTDIFRAIYNNVWAKAPFNRDWSGFDVVVLTDCRFLNEVEATEDAGGVIIRLLRPTGLSDNHVSETALDNCIFKHVYTNDGSLEDLKDYLQCLMSNLTLL